MSYAKAADLLGFALELASRHGGMTYSEVDDLSGEIRKIVVWRRGWA